MIIDDIKKANLIAMKEHNSNLRAIYSVLMNKHLQATVESRTSGKEVNDDTMIRIIQKTIKELDEEKANYEKAGNTEQVKLISEQKDALAKYLPQMMSEAEIESIIAKMEDKSIPTVMKYFKANYGANCDMKVVQAVLKKF